MKKNFLMMMLTSSLFAIVLSATACSHSSQKQEESNDSIPERNVTDTVLIFEQAKWKDTDYGFKYPDIMIPSTAIFVEDMCGTVYMWNYEDVCLSCWPLLGAWALMDLPEEGRNLTEKVKVTSITYRNGHDGLFSGITDDGRVWYMKIVPSGGTQVFAKILVLIYPKTKERDVAKLIDIVKNWK